MIYRMLYKTLQCLLFSHAQNCYSDIDGSRELSVTMSSTEVDQSTRSFAVLSAAQ